MLQLELTLLSLTVTVNLYANIIDPFLDPQVETGGDSRFFEFPGP